MTPAAHIDDHQRRARLVARHRLDPHHRTDDPVAITESLVALHSTDPSTVFLSAMARMVHPALHPLHDALYRERSLVRHHGMRRTLWVMTPAVARLVHASCTADLAMKEWQNLEAAAARSGIDDAPEWLGAITEDVLAALHRLGPSSTRALGKAVPELTRKITIGQGNYAVEVAAHSRVLLSLGFDGRIVRTEPTGTWQSSEYTWRAMDDWLPGGVAGADPAAASAGLVRRYVAAFGPVTTVDVQWWAGWTKGRAVAALGASGAVQVSLDEGGTGWVLDADADVTEPDPAPADVALLPSLDPTAMGWKERSFYLGDHSGLDSALFDRSGNIGPTVWSGGRVIGVWAQRPDGAVVHELLVPVDRTVSEAVRSAATRLTDLLGGTVVTPRFPTPLQRALAGSTTPTA